MTNNKNCSHALIVKYWETRESESGLGVDWIDAIQRCWRCANKSKLERCHIVPKSLGGQDDPSNLVLLCGRCHREAPNSSDGKMMWVWIRKTCTTHYNTFWQERGLKEFEKMFDRKPFNKKDFLKISDKKLRSIIEKVINKDASFHFGEGGLNPSTIASLYMIIEKEIEKRFTVIN